MNDEKCLIWGTYAVRQAYPTGIDFDSPRAGGPYTCQRNSLPEFSRKILNPLQELDERAKARLTTLLVDQRRLGNKCPSLTAEMIASAKDKPDLSIGERADRLLQYFKQRTPYMGQYIDDVVIDMKEYMDPEIDKGAYAWSESVHRSEYFSLCGFLEEQKWLECINKPTGRRLPEKITTQGYIHLEELRAGGLDSSKAFVAMWFDESMDNIYENAMKPAIEEAGYEPYRIDKREHNNKIDDEIIAEIRRSRFIVADFTYGKKDGVRGGVYYEAGFAHGLNIPVIFTCDKALENEIHFDTRQFNHIFWEDAEDLKKQLRNRIGATIGQGSRKQQNRASS